ncbi:MAG: DUF4838 domain-containing protein [Pirellulales bacterium]|nr:DUF4838 domain-containing protein [Pirellulales bacterium]
MKNAFVKLACLALFVPGVGAAAPVEVIRDRASSHAIYHEPGAPSSVVMAASELQHYLEKAGGVKLQIVTQPREPMISLGANAASRSAGLSLDGVPLEGFRIVTRGRNVYILGPDTADNELTPGGGTSAGTRNGVYTFLEKYLGVRWLVPGEHGDYVPRSGEVLIPETDLADAPFFLNRRVPYTQERRPEVKRWWARQRLGWSLFLNHSHNWEGSVPASLYDQHPDWFAQRGGVRVPPSGRYKLCVTNPGLVRAYADAAIAFFDQRPQATCYSLSPSDSAGWCECADCSARYEKDPNEELSVTPAILSFYNDVARLVAQRHPGKFLAGYVYAQYVFPPKTPIRLEPNVFLVWAPSFDYGYTLFRPQLQRQWEDLLGQWTGVTRNLSYYDLPVNISTEAGAPNPPGLKILKFLYPRLKAGGIKGVYVYGIDAWGRGGPLNYLLARLAWDPEADVEALFDEFCDKAYGAGGPEINRLFRALDAEMERHYLANPKASYTLTNEIMQDVYAKNFPQLERLYRSAEAKVQDPEAKARLAMIGENLTVLAWNLRQFKMLPDPEASSFYLPDAEFFALLTSKRGSLALEPPAEAGRPSAVNRKVQVSPAQDVPGAEPMRRFRLRGDQHLVLLPTGREEVRIRFSQITARGKLITYRVFSPDGSEVTSGLASAEVPIVLSADGNKYYHLVVSAASATFMIEATGAAWAVDGAFGNKGLHLLGATTPLYFHVPAGVESFHLSLEADPPGEVAVATLYAPDGRKAGEFDCTAVSVDRKLISVPSQAAGWWKLAIEKAPAGPIDDVWVKPGDELSGYFSLEPARALGVTRVPEGTK